jgi:hypothetical protein
VLIGCNRKGPRKTLFWVREQERGFPRVRKTEKRIAMGHLCALSQPTPTEAAGKTSKILKPLKGMF